MKTPSLIPQYRPARSELSDGTDVKAPSFCRERLAAGDARCLAHYEAAVARAGFVLCPYGFTTLPAELLGETVFLTSVVAAPRFGDSKEAERAKRFPEVRVSRATMLAMKGFFAQVSELEKEMEDRSLKRLPQALHELRKLNAIVKANVEKLGDPDEARQEIRDLSGASELMSNIFDTIEALADVAGLRQVKLTDYIAAYDLAFKAKKIYQVRAKQKPIHITVNGDSHIGIRGSKKTFPIVLTVLLENAIKYGRPNTTIEISVRRDGSKCVIEVANKTDFRIDPVLCFDRGARFDDGLTEGSGLGLYLAREVVKSHGGSIACDVLGDTVKMRVAVPEYLVAQSGRKVLL